MAKFRYQQLAQTLRHQIESGRWQKGDSLPSVRQLMAQHQLSRATVLHALAELEQSDLIQAQPRRGYFILPPVTPMPSPDMVPVSRPPRLFSIDDVMQDVMRNGAAFDLLPQQGQFDQPGPEQVLLQRDISRAMRHSRGLSHQYYDDPQGFAQLRAHIAARLRQQGCHYAPEQLLITHGCQHALLLALLSCTRAGDVVAVESPGFFGTLQLLQQLGLKVLPLPCQPDTGLQPGDLAKALQKWPVKALVITPSFSTPTGACMPLKARQQLVQLARQHNMTLIEDHIYAELDFNTSTHTPLAALAPEQVILCASFSKTLSRDLRLGYIASAQKTPQLTHLKQITTLTNSRFIEQGVDNFITAGSYDRHLQRLRRKLRIQCHDLQTLLTTLFPDCYFSQPKGGLCLWLTLNEKVDTVRLYHIARESGIMITPGPMFSSEPGLYRHCLRLSFAHPWNPARRDALTRVQALAKRDCNTR